MDVTSSLLGRFRPDFTQFWIGIVCFVFLYFIECYGVLLNATGIRYITLLPVVTMRSLVNPVFDLLDDSIAISTQFTLCPPLAYSKSPKPKQMTRIEISVKSGPKRPSNEKVTSENVIHFFWSFFFQNHRKRVTNIGKSVSLETL